MIRCGNRLRLHQKDIERLSRLTGTTPPRIHSVDELNNYVERYLNEYEGNTPEARLLEILLSEEKTDRTV